MQCCAVRKPASEPRRPRAMSEHYTAATFFIYASNCGNVPELALGAADFKKLWPKQVSIVSLNKNDAQNRKIFLSSKRAIYYSGYVNNSAYMTGGIFGKAHSSPEVKPPLESEQDSLQIDKNQHISEHLAQIYLGDLISGLLWAFPKMPPGSAVHILWSKSVKAFQQKFVLHASLFAFSNQLGPTRYRLYEKLW